MSTKIEWTDVTDNIIVAAQGGWWCRKISPGCKNCYAAKLNQSSYFHGNKLAYAGEPPPLRLREDVIDGWKRQRKPRRHFVASMTDVFGDWVSTDWTRRFLRGMWCAPSQTFQVLTKRADVMRDRIKDWLAFDGLDRVPANIWLGTSVENQECADERIPHLLTIPATRFLSCEPLLGPIDLAYTCFNGADSFGQLPGIHWVICGGESGPGARPMHPEWARDIRDQCKAAGVPFFFNQWGAWAPACAQYPSTDSEHEEAEEASNYGDIALELNGVIAEGYQPTTNRCWLMNRVGKKRAGRLLDGVKYSEFPATSPAPAPEMP